MRLTEYFYDFNKDKTNDDHPRFRNKSTWTPPTDRELSLNTFLDAVKLDISNIKPIRTLDNLSKSERQALQELKQRPDIVIKPADKGSGTVVMNLQWYIDECNRQLNDTKFYRPLHDEDKTTHIQQRVTEYINRMFRSHYIDDKTCKYLIQSDTKPGRRFYILPKIHKPEQIFSSRDAIRKAKEAYLITRANTLEPNGLNKRDETY
ncbi:hypothetical protein QZH41_007540 [Actinostola sp. cb2023]|nr:hypothetical protein QZH41_007540 [Actinostola sp. cb2023]